MRPRGLYAVFNDGRVTHIAEGYRLARQLSPERAYKRFRPGQWTEAEEFACWWNYTHPHPVLGDQSHHGIKRLTADVPPPPPPRGVLSVGRGLQTGALFFLATATGFATALPRACGELFPIVLAFTA